MIDTTNGMQIVERIDKLLKERNLNRVALADAIGIKPQNISALSVRGTVPAGDICLNVAEFLKVSAVWLITGKEEGMSNEEKNLLSIYQKLSAEQKDTIWTLMEKWEREYELKEEAERMA
jgi:transcriptional regulator with XRE-family HTH domain